MKKTSLAGSAAIDLITDNGTATFKGHSNHPGIAGWIRETETVLASVFDFPEMMWMDLKSIESNIRFRLRLAETKSQKEVYALRVVGREGLVLGDFPVNLRTPVVCAMAVEENPLALKHVPVECKTKQMCIEAALKNGEAARFIPKAFFDQELCDLIVGANRGAFSYIPNRFKTLPMSVKVVNIDISEKSASSRIGGSRRVCKKLNTIDFLFMRNQRNKNITTSIKM